MLKLAAVASCLLATLGAPLTLAQGGGGKGWRDAGPGHAHIAEAPRPHVEQAPPMREDRPARPMPVIEGPGADVALATIEALRTAREEGVAAVRAATKTGIDTVRTLAGNESPDEAVRIAGRQAADAIGDALLDADTAISERALATIKDLRASGADRRTIMAVIRAREAAANGLHTAAQRGLGAVMRSVDHAVNDADDAKPRDPREHRGPREDGPRGRREHQRPHNAPRR